MCSPLACANRSTIASVLCPLTTENIDPGPYTYTDSINTKGGGSWTYKVCEAVFYSEFRPRHLWEYTCNEEYQRSIREEDQEYETARYEEIMQYVKGGPFHRRDPDSLDDVLAFIAKILITGNPGLSRRARKEELLAAANEILEFDSILDALTNQSIETVRRVAIRETNRYLGCLSESG
jgi:hypothetical protein